MKNRIFAMIMALVMAIGLLPVSAFAGNDEPKGDWYNPETDTPNSVYTATEFARLYRNEGPVLSTNGHSVAHAMWKGTDGQYYIAIAAQVGIESSEGYTVKRITKPDPNDQNGKKQKAVPRMPLTVKNADTTKEDYITDRTPDDPKVEGSEKQSKYWNLLQLTADQLNNYIKPTPTGWQVNVSMILGKGHDFGDFDLPDNIAKDFIGNLKISKAVEAAGGVTAPDTEFTFKVEFTGNKVSDEDNYSYKIGDTTYTVPNGGEIKLKANQTATFNGLPAGAEYTVTEIDVANDGFDQVQPANNGAATGTITANNTAEAKFINQYTKTTETPDPDPKPDPDLTADLTFKKVDSVNITKGLADAKFTLTKANETNGVEAISGDNGIVTFQNLTEGTYTLKEVTPPAGYKENNTTYTVEVRRSGESLTAEISSAGTGEDQVQYITNEKETETKPEPTGTLTVTKEVRGLSDADFQRLAPDFAIKVTHGNGGGNSDKVYTLKIGDPANTSGNEIYSNTIQDGKYTWTIENVGWGNCTVEENRHNIHGYSCTSTGVDKKIVLNKNNPTDSFVLTNTYTKNEEETPADYTLTVTKEVTAIAGEPVEADQDSYSAKAGDTIEWIITVNMGGAFPGREDKNGGQWLTLSDIMKISGEHYTDSGLTVYNKTKVTQEYPDGWKPIEDLNRYRFGWANATKEFKVTYTVAEDGSDNGKQIINTATVTPEGGTAVTDDAPPVNVTVPDPIPTPTPGLVVKKDVTKITSADGTVRQGKATAYPGDTITWTIKVTQNGAGAIENISLADVLKINGTLDTSKTVTVYNKRAADQKGDELNLASYRFSLHKDGNFKCFFAEYKVTDGDVDKEIVNVATAGNGTVTGEGTAPGVDIDKTPVDPSTPVDPDNGNNNNGGGRPSKPDDGVDIEDPEVPGADLNTVDHFAYIIGYHKDYETGEPTDDQSRKPVKPEGSITRAEVATIFFRMLTDESRTECWSTTNDYSDVPETAWYNNAVSTLSNAGIINGYKNGTFKPNGKITRAEFATIAVRFFEVTYEGEDLFPDIADHWAREFINEAAQAGLINGYPDGTFGPQKLITRAEAVTMVNRALNRTPDPAHFLPDMLVWPDNKDTSKWYYADMQEATNSHDYEFVTAEDGTEYEAWTAMQPIRDWEAFEKEWSDAGSAANPGDVVE